MPCLRGAAAPCGPAYGADGQRVEGASGLTKSGEVTSGEFKGTGTSEFGSE